MKYVKAASQAEINLMKHLVIFRDVKDTNL